MNNDTGGNRRPRRAGFLAVMAAVAVLAAACGGSASSASSASNPGGVGKHSAAYQQCMRAHGEANPDVPVGSSSGQLQAAQNACANLVGGGAASPASMEQLLIKFLRFAECMRAHGLPDFPDPTLTSQGVNENLKKVGIQTFSPQYQAAARGCQHVAPLQPGGGA
jgi:hypothetical protein